MIQFRIFFFSLLFVVMYVGGVIIFYRKLGVFLRFFIERYFFFDLLIQTQSLILSVII